VNDVDCGLWTVDCASDQTTLDWTMSLCHYVTMPSAHHLVTISPSDPSLRVCYIACVVNPIVSSSLFTHRHAAAASSHASGQLLQPHGRRHRSLTDGVGKGCWSTDINPPPSPTGVT
jgi:hypothetical protein